VSTIRLSALLQRVPSQSADLVEATRKRLNQRIRDLLRRETGLRFVPKNREGPRVQVSTHVQPGRPEELEDRELSENAWALPYLLDLRTDLTAIAESGPRVLGRLKRAVDDDPQAGRYLHGRLNGLPSAIGLVEQLLELLSKDDPIPGILGVNQDVLGVYRYRLRDKSRGAIELYWGIIGLVAGGLGVRLDALAAVVLVHELAHAYTHLGFDIDSRQWPSPAFLEAPHELKEGLAQYYTHMLVPTLEEQVPGICEAYRKLLIHQHLDYKTHLHWIDPEKGPELFREDDDLQPDGKATPEEVRFAMLATRRSTEECTLENFNAALKSASNELSGK
jgi:hypothetical protein